MTIRNLFAALLLLMLLVVPGISQTHSTARGALDRGNSWFAGGSYEQAIKEYESVGPDSAQLYAVALYNIGVCYYELWRTTEAIAFYRRAIKERNGSYSRASHALGVALEDEGKLREAKAAYEQALVAADGDYPPAHYQLGLIAANAGDIQVAAALFRKALNRPGEHVIASHNNLGVMLARMHRLKEAEKEFATAFRLSNGKFSDAAHNLDLCRRLLSGTVDADFASLRVTRVCLTSRQPC